MLTNISLFSGAGGLDLGARLVGGFKTVAYVECDPYAQGVLMSRMRDGSLDDAPIFEDVRTFRGTSLRGSIDVVSGGFPCQPHSQCGQRRGGADDRNLWPDYLRIVRDVGPRFVIAENVLGIFDTGYALEVLADLEESGYCATPYKTSACSAGSPHMRRRVFFLAHAAGSGRGKIQGSIRTRSEIMESARRRHQSVWAEDLSPELCRVADGLEFRMDRHRLCGNGVVPQQAAPAWQKIKDLAMTATNQTVTRGRGQ